MLRIEIASVIEGGLGDFQFLAIASLVAIRTWDSTVDTVGGHESISKPNRTICGDRGTGTERIEDINLVRIVHN